MELTHKELVKFYTMCIILNSLYKGCTPTYIQLKTGISYTTILKIINILEERDIVKTNIKIEKQGKIRQIVYISEHHKKIAGEFLKHLESYYRQFNNGEQKQRNKDYSLSYFFYTE